MRLHVMQVVQIDVIGPQYLQTPIQVAFEPLIIPRVTLAGEENFIPIAGEQWSNHPFARTVVARSIPIIDALRESRFEERVASFYISGIAAHEFPA
jgi:hypothetical protein